MLRVCRAVREVTSEGGAWTRTSRKTHFQSSMASPASLLVATYNVLSPGYFRKPDAGKKKMEASHPDAYSARIRQQASALRETGASLIALQELWMKPNVLAMLGEAFPEANFGTLAVRRPGGAKEDGVALLFDRRVLRLLADFGVAGEWRSLPGERCIAMGHFELCSTGQPLIAVSVHLTYPHNAADEALRTVQAARLLADVASFAAAQGLPTDTPVALCGDFNGVEDAAHRVLEVEGGFVSAFHSLHGRHPVATHLDHAGAAQGVDAVFMRPWGAGGVWRPPQAAYLLPVDAGDGAVMYRPCPQTRDSVEWVTRNGGGAGAASDSSGAGECMLQARREEVGPWCVSGAAATGGESGAGEEAGGEGAPFVGMFSTLRPLAQLRMVDWCNLSDHRPLVVSLLLGAANSS
jgi:endonuclease/exonuclease/phosphatase family metal-dependent hydrolase